MKGRLCRETQGHLLLGRHRSDHGGRWLFRQTAMLLGIPIAAVGVFYYLDTRAAVHSVLGRIAHAALEPEDAKRLMLAAGRYGFLPRDRLPDSASLSVKVCREWGFVPVTDLMTLPSNTTAPRHNTRQSSRLRSGIRQSWRCCRLDIQHGICLC